MNRNLRSFVGQPQLQFLHSHVVAALEAVSEAPSSHLQSKEGR